MADDINIQLADDLFAGATGGVSVDPSVAAQYDVVGTVLKFLEGNDYEVRFNDGAVVIATSEVGGTLPKGAPVGLRAIRGGWIMKRI